MSRKNFKDRKIRLCIYLFKNNCVSFDDVIKNGSSLTEYRIKGFSREEMSLFVKTSVSFQPKWIRFFNGFLIRNIEGVFNSSSSAILLVRHAGRIFAFTFGYGRSFLNLNLVEDNFGLKVALNSIDINKIRSVDIKNLDTVVRQSKIQTSQVGTIDNFGLNIDRDILNAVTGLSNDEAFGKQISGAVSLHISIAIKIDKLPELCSKLLEKFDEKSYKERFPWVDHINEVKNPILKEELDEFLINAIRNKNFEGIFLAIPEIVDWKRVYGFKYKASDEEVREDIDIRDVLPSDEEMEYKVSINWLKRKEVLCVGPENEEVIYKWPLYRCINYEIKKNGADGAIYLLTAGKWFKIDTDYVTSVSESIKEIPEYSNLNFPEHEGEFEEDYNKKVCNVNQDRCILMDGKNIHYGGGQSRVEFCDLFIDKKDFIHVKRFRGSACLSHLFFQGHNSAYLLLTDEKFVRELNKKLPEGWKFSESDQIKAADYLVVFAIISKVKKGIKEIIPFFSRVSLLQIYRRLKIYGYNVALAKIESK